MLKVAFRPGVANARSLKTYPYFDQLINDMFPNVQKLDMGAMIYFFRHFPDVDITPLLKNIQAPTLVVAGDRDNIVSPDQAKLIAQNVPNSHLVMMKGVGHLLFIEQPAEYEQIIRQWMQNND